MRRIAQCRAHSKRNIFEFFCALATMKMPLATMKMPLCQGTTCFAGSARKGMIGLNSPKGCAADGSSSQGLAKTGTESTSSHRCQSNANVLTRKCKTDRRSFQRRQEGKSFAFFYGSCARILSRRSVYQSNRPLIFFESRGHSLSPRKRIQTYMSRLRFK